MVMNPRKTISLILGIVLLALGVPPLLSALKLTTLALPDLPELLLWVIFIAGGVWLLFDASKEALLNKGLMRISLVIGIIVIALGLLPVLQNFGVRVFEIPESIQIVVDIVVTLAGLLLVKGAFKGF